jgi:hypothetical protein
LLSYNNMDINFIFFFSKTTFKTRMTVNFAITCLTDKIVQYWQTIK